MRSPRWLTVTLLLVSVLAARVSFDRDTPLVTMVIVGAALAAVAAVRGTRLRMTGAGGFPIREALVVSWLLLSFVITHRFTAHARPDQFLDAEWFARVLVYTGAGLVSLLVIRRHESSLRRARPPLALLLLPGWATLSFLWSGTPGPTFVEGAQLVATGMLAWATIAVGRVDRPLFDDVVDSVLRWFVYVVLALTAWGMVDRGATSLFDDGARFTWYGAHPLGSGFLLCAAVVVVAFAPPAMLRMPRAARLASLGFLGIALYANHSRQMVVAAVLTVLVGLLVTGRPIVRRVGLPLLGATACAAMLYIPERVESYVLRSGDLDNLAGGNGRIQLWQVGFDSMESAFDWWFGHGKGITHTLFIEHFPWAISAHNSVLAALVGVGLIGVALFLVMVGSVIRDSIRSRLWETPRGLVLALLLLPLLSRGLFGDSLMTAAPAFTLLFLVGTVARVTLERTEHDRALGRPAVSPADPGSLAAAGPTGRNA